MYIGVVLLLVLVLPVGSILIEHFYVPTDAPLLVLVGKWFVFWSVGARLGLAGLRQFFQPQFTAEQIFGLKNPDVLPLIRELGIANFATGVVGLASLARPDFVLPVAISAAIFYGIAGVRHVMAPHRSGNENIAMISDLFVFAVLAVFVAFTLL